MNQELSESEEQSVEIEALSIFETEQIENIKKYLFQSIPITEYEEIDELKMFLQRLQKFKENEPEFSTNSINEIGATHIEKLRMKVEKTIEYLKDRDDQMRMKKQSKINGLNKQIFGLIN